MRDSIRKLSALALLLVIPLQSIAAASLSVLQCPPVEAGAADSSYSDGDTAQEGDGNTVKHSPDHFSCHQPSSGIPIIPAQATTVELPVFVATISFLSSLFLPEQPQRPPFSAGT